MKKGSRGNKNLSQKITWALALITVISTIIADIVANFCSDFIHTSLMSGFKPSQSSQTTSQAVSQTMQTGNLQNSVAIWLAIVGVNLLFLAVFTVAAILISKRIARNISGPILQITNAANSIADGNLNVDLAVKAIDETGILAEAFQKIKKSLTVLVEESNSLKEAGLQGNLSLRGDVSKLKGSYADIISGFNQTLDSIVVPLDESSAVLKNMAFNDYTLKMSDGYKGKMKELADSINEVQTGLMSIQIVFEKIAQGDISMLEQLKQTGARSKNDHQIPAMLATMESIRDLIDQANMLASAALSGDLGVRGDTERLQGGYRQVIEGMNNTMDAFAAPAEEASRVLRMLAQGNLAVEMEGVYQGEYNQIKQSLNEAIRSFGELLAQIRAAADQVAAGSRQISDASQSLSEGTTEQASSIEELTSSISEIAAQTKENATSALQASEFSENVKAEAAQGNQKMSEMLLSMKEINESSANISKIIKVIDDIAFQTNILALNAAVEAARAGQYGKGFAVVAEEVRNLAARSADAAKNTTSLIEGSIGKVQTGTKAANETADTLSRIVQSAQQSADLIHAIAAASNQQATAIAQIDQGIARVSNVVQTNSATAEESAASSEELSSQAEMLNEMVGKFHLKNNVRVMPSAQKTAHVQTAASR